MLHAQCSRLQPSALTTQAAVGENVSAGAVNVQTASQGPSARLVLSRMLGKSAAGCAQSWAAARDMAGAPRTAAETLCVSAWMGGTGRRALGDPSALTTLAAAGLGAEGAPTEFANAMRGISGQGAKLAWDQVQTPSAKSRAGVSPAARVMVGVSVN